MGTITCRLLTLAAASLSVTNLAYSADRQYNIEIARQPIAEALNKFSQQTGLQVSYFRESLPRELFVGPISGQYTADAAIAELLLPNGLSFTQPNDRTIVVLGATAAAPRHKSISADVGSVALQSTFMRLAATHEGAESSSSAAAGESQPRGGAALSEKQARDFEEVIVTAQKRAERLQDVPISISVLGGEELDKFTVRGVAEALGSVPGVATMQNRQGGGTNVTVRGVAAGGPLFNGSSPVAYYVDSVPFALVKTAIAPDASAYDLQRVEVLRGPQGTLYGASALNGVVRVLTRDANMEDFEFKVRTSTSSTEDGSENYRGDIAINAPLIEDKLAVRAVLGYQDSGGWIDKPNKKDANDEELRNLRLKVNAQPTERLSVGLSAWLSRADYGAPSTSGEDRRVFSVADESTVLDYDAYGLKLGYEFSSFSISSMSSYLKYESGGALDITATRAGVAPQMLFTGFDADVFSQEIILNSELDGDWRWSLGGMFRDAEDTLVQTLAALPAPIDFTNRSKSSAVFGEVTRLFLDKKLEVTVGARYFDDDVTVLENVPGTGNPNQPLYRGEASFDKVTPRVIVTWHAGTNLTTYASYSEGFRSGFPQDPPVIRAVPDFAPVDADSLKNYEIGAKGSLWDGAITFDSAVYFIDWQDAQQSLRVAIPGTAVFVTALINSESASGMGVDFSATARPTDRIELGINVSWNDLAMDAPVISRGAVLFDEGERPNLSPEYTLGASADYILPLGSSGYESRFSASANYTSALDRRTMSAGGVRLIAFGESTTLTRASVSLQSPDHWGLALFVDNLGDERGMVLGQPGDPTVFGVRPRPRTIGLQFDYHY